jgi:Fe-S-cluster containining protein
MLSPDEQAAYLQAAANVREAAVAHLAADRSRPVAIAFVSNLQRGVDKVMDTAANAGSNFACKSGCSHCCNVQVHALEPEVFRIAGALRKLGPVVQEGLLEKLRQHAAMVRGLTLQDHRIPCPFLVDRLCSIYSIRPAVCRKAHSLDVEACRTAGATIPQDLATLMKAEAMIQGTAEAYSALGMPAAGHELGQAVLVALSDPTAEARWQGGASVFYRPVTTIGPSPE